MTQSYDAQDIITRLVRRFPPRDHANLRMALYERLGRLCEDSEVGSQIYNLIAAVCADAAGKRDPGRYFSHVVIIRLRESSLLPTAEI